MSLLFGGVNSDRVNCGSAAALDNLTVGTYAMWCYPTSLVSGNPLMTKGTLGVTGFNFRLNGTVGDIELRIARTVTTAFVSKNLPLVVNTWCFVAVAWNTGVSPVAHLYGGNLTATVSECTYSSSIDGSGSWDDSALDVLIGQNSSLTSAFNGRIGWTGIWNRALSLGDLRRLQDRTQTISTSSDTASNLLNIHLGYNGTGTQPDWSGNGNNGTLTGTSISNHIPLGPLFGYDTMDLYKTASVPSFLRGRMIGI